MAVPMPKMKIQNPTFYDETGEWRVTFYPLKKNECPGFSHRVVINSRRAGWLEDQFRPSAKTAAYFLSQFGAYIEAALAKAS